MEVKLAILSALGSWTARSADVVQLDLVSFLSSGPKEKEALRRGHLRCLRAICRNTDAVYQVSYCIKFYLAVFCLLFLTWLFLSCFGDISKFFFSSLQLSSLLEPLIQLVKTGFTKGVQRLDGIYALLLVGKIAAVDIKAGLDLV